MSGYLRRVAGAVSAKARVHPFVEPIYGRPTESAAPVVEEVERRVVRQVPAVSDQRPVAQRDVVNPTHDGEMVMDGALGMSGKPTSQKRDAGHPVMGPAESEGERFEALLPVVAEGAGFVRPKRDGEAVAEGAKATDPFAMSLRKDGPPGEQVGETRGEGSKPMVDLVEHGAPEVLRPAVRDGSPAHRNMAATDGAPGQMAQRRMERTAQARQGDEIQIHIGRIEVIAMPPAAPKSVAVPARKTQSLDEYLRQRNGRPG